MEHDAAVAALKQHVTEFIQLELTNKLDEYLLKLTKSGALNLSEWDGVSLAMPRTVTTAILEEAASRVIWSSHERQYRREINNLKFFL